MGSLIFPSSIGGILVLPAIESHPISPLATLGAFIKQRRNFRLPGNCTTPDIMRNKVFCPHRFRAPAGLLLLDLCRPESQTAKLQAAYCCRSVLQINHSIWRHHLMSPSCGGGKRGGVEAGHQCNQAGNMCSPHPPIVPNLWSEKGDVIVVERLVGVCSFLGRRISFFY